MARTTVLLSPYTEYWALGPMLQGAELFLLLHFVTKRVMSTLIPGSLLVLPFQPLPAPLQISLAWCYCNFGPTLLGELQYDAECQPVQYTKSYNIKARSVLQYISAIDRHPKLVR